MLNKGRKFGRDLVRAVSDPLDGILISDTVQSDGDNQWRAPGTSRQIEGIVIRALKGNAGTIYVTGAEGNQDGYFLDAGDPVSIATDDLAKVQVWIPTSGDGFAWLAIEQARG